MSEKGGWIFGLLVILVGLPLATVLLRFLSQLPEETLFGLAIWLVGLVLSIVVGTAVRSLFPAEPSVISGRPEPEDGEDE